MHEAAAGSLANDILGKVLQYQPEVFGTQALGTDADAQQVAKRIAEFRKALFEEIKTHPN